MAATSVNRLNLSVQYVSAVPGIPSRTRIRPWVRAAIDVDGRRGGEITLRFVDDEESQALNREYRGKDYPTNVLSFPYETDPVVCGDLVICAPVVIREAQEQHVPDEAHYAHLVVHGVLHLLGYDHEADDSEAMLMESKERSILMALGFDDPYRTDE